MTLEKIGQALGSVGLGAVVFGAVCLILAAYKPAPDAEDVNVTSGILVFAFGLAGLSTGLLVALFVLMRPR